MRGDIELRLSQGIEAAQAGDKRRARDNFIHVIELDERNEKAWLWLNSIVETTADKTVCLENILVINPGNTQAATDLQRLRQQPVDPFAPPPALPRLTSPLMPAEHVCPRCDYRNPGWAYLCDRCGADLQPIDVREALGLTSRKRTLTSLAMAMLSASVWRAIVWAVPRLLTGGNEPVGQLAASAFRCAIEAFVPGLLLALTSIPVTLLTWVGARLVGGKQSLKTHARLTIVALSSWVILVTLLAPITTLVLHLLGSQGLFDLLSSKGALVLVGMVGGLIGMAWLNQAIRAAHRLPAIRAGMVTLLMAALGIALSFGLYLLASEWYLDLVDMLVILFQPCSGQVGIRYLGLRP